MRKVFARILLVFAAGLSASLSGQIINSNHSSKQIVWQTVVTVTDAASNQLDLTFGQATEATDSLDRVLDEQELPPYPPSGVFDARFLFPSPFQTISSWKDFRATYQNRISWQIRVQPGSAGYPVKYSWNRAALPQYGNFFLRDMFGGLVVNVNMRLLSSFSNSNSGLNPLKIDFDIVSAAVDENTNPLNAYRLLPNYPNPFNPSTSISYSIPALSPVNITIYDCMGRETAILVNRVQPAGVYSVKWDAVNMPAGVYYCAMTAGNYRAANKLMLIK